MAVPVPDALLVRRQLSLCLLALVVAACSADPEANDGYSKDCSPAEQYRGFCLEHVRSDGGGSGTGASDAGPGVETGECEMEGATRPCHPDDDVAGEGRCTPGEQLCTSGQWGRCVGYGMPLPAESCNGEDDDCNGETDDVPDISCDTDRLGACEGGKEVCQAGGVTVCQPVLDPTAETCNGEDDDCDGSLDEGASLPCYPKDATGCSQNEDRSFTCVGRCAPGAEQCSAGMQDDCSGMVMPEGDDGCTASGVVAYDDDCDGEIDEDCTCTGSETQECYGGAEGTSTVAPCTTGMQTCSGGKFGACAGDRVPAQETCENDGVNDDCDALSDDIPNRGMACVDEQAQGICRAGTFNCQAGEFGCVTPEARASEECDGVDDDCNGVVDNGFMLLTDELNCGGCGVQCSEGLSCCGGQCVELETSEDHCGECGVPCADGGSCCGGQCVDTDVDADNCGACDQGCGAGRECCGGGCVDTRVNTDHCGACQAACDPGEACCNGACAAESAPECATCEQNCTGGEECCSGSCVDTADDESNCGACGETCDSGEVCCGGACVASDAAHCGQACSDCDGGDLCCSGSCVASDAANCNACGNVCTAGLSCCGATGCKNLLTDPGNCGSCGQPVDSGDMCTTGHSCPPNNLWCNGACTSIVNNNAHCGSCNHACGVLQSCQGTTCRLL